VEETPGQEELDPKRIGRRTVLKRIGAGAAIAWTAPVLTSLRSVAFASQSNPGACTECAGDFCFGQTICGSSGPLQLCGCAQPAGQEGGTVCFCYEDDLCINRVSCPNGQSDCPIGQVCVHSCCDQINGGVPVCWSPCGTSAPRGQQGSKTKRQGPTGMHR
jgi:hypothetical protein